MTSSVHAMGQENVSATLTVAVPAAKVFAVLADPTAHSAIDGTEVTLTYDWSAVPRSIREYLHFPPFGPEHLTNSLHHLAELARSSPAP
jgi:hypothetical protein